MVTHSRILAWRIPLDIGTWWATAHGVSKESDMTKRLSTHAHIHTHTHAAVEHMKAWGLFQRVGVIEGDTQDEKAKQEAGPEL